MAEQLQLNFDNDDWFKPYNKPETLTSLAAKYNVTYITFRKWVKPIMHKINFRPRRTFTPAELKVILEFLGEYGGE